MKTLTIDIPDSVNENDLKLQLAALLFERGVLSSGQAAGMASISKREFLECVGKFGISVFGETEEDIEKVING